MTQMFRKLHNKTRQKVEEKLVKKSTSNSITNLYKDQKSLVSSSGNSLFVKSKLVDKYVLSDKQKRDRAHPPLSDVVIVPIVPEPTIITGKTKSLEKSFETSQEESHDFISAADLSKETYS
jgi:hypothetical protein